MVVRGWIRSAAASGCTGDGSTSLRCPQPSQGGPRDVGKPTRRLEAPLRLRAVDRMHARSRRMHVHCTAGAAHLILGRRHVRRQQVDYLVHALLAGLPLQPRHDDSGVL